MIRTNLFLLSFCWSLSIISQNKAPEIEWERTFGGKGNDVALSAAKTNDGIVIAGYTGSKGMGKKDALIIKLDNAGNIIWERSFGGIENDIAKDIICTANNEYIFAGYTNSKGNGKKDVWVVKLDEHGNLIWDRYFGSNRDDAANSLISDNDGNILITGFKNTPNGNNILVVKLNRHGNIV